MARVRLFVSGGFMGYWCVFYNLVIGKFNDYSGNFDSCFLMTKKNVKKHVLQGVNPTEMVDIIKKTIEISGFIVPANPQSIAYNN